MRDERRFFAQREFRRIAPLHEPRKHLSQQRRGRPEIFGETILDETGDACCKNRGTRRSGVPPSPSRSQSPARTCCEKIRGGRGRRRFGKGDGHEHSAVIVGTAGENFLPRFGMSRREIMAVGQLVDFLRRQLAEDVARQLAQKRVAQTVDAFEMLEREE